MFSTAFILIILAAISCNASIFFSNYISEVPQPCANHSICYEKLNVPGTPVMGNMEIDLAPRPFLFNIYRTYELCSTVEQSIKKLEEYNISCINYFCLDTSLDLIENILSKSINVSWVQWHFNMINYCYYCNHSTFSIFRNMIIQNATCPLFWRHSPTYCSLTDDGKESPTILTFLRNSYIHYRSRLNPELLSLDVSKLRDFLILTYTRTMNNDEIGEKERGEVPYLCFNMNRNAYTIYGDIYDWILVPFRYTAVPIITLAVKLLVLIPYIFLVFIPKFDSLFRQYFRIGVRMGVKGFLSDVLFDMRNQVNFFILLGIVIGIGEEFVYYNGIALWYRKMAGLFRICFCGLVILASGILMLLWAHVYYASQRLSTEISRGIVAYIIAYPIIALHRRDLDKLFSAALFTSVIWLLLFAIGFIIYGCRIYIMMSKVMNVSIFKMKLIRAMILIDLLFLSCIFWLTMLGIDYTMAESIGWFLHIYKTQFLDANFILLVISVSYVLIDARNIRDCSLYRCCIPLWQTANENERHRSAEQKLEYRAPLIEHMTETDYTSTSDHIFETT